MSKPVVAIVGRPNVGKSTLFNALAGDNISIVKDTPGVTRDRIYADVTWLDRTFTLIDTGGIEPDSSDIILSRMREQAQIAIDTADVIIFITDVRQGLVDSDAKVADMLRRSGKPVRLVVNKVDSHQKYMMDVYEFYNLGIGEPIPISAANRQGLGDMLDEVIKEFPDKSEEEDQDDIPKIAIVGKPNVGKSSLINKLLGEERVIVSNIAGTTRDAIDTKVTWNKKDYIFIDTAGLRRKGKVKEEIERYSVIRTVTAVERADVVVVVIDASEGVTEQDAKIAGIAHDRGKGIIVAVNKWDAIEKNDKTIYKTGLMDDPDRTQRLYDSGAKFSSEIVEEASPILSFLISWLLPLIIIIGFGQLMYRQMAKKAGGDSMMFGMGGMGKSNAKVYVKSSNGIKFTDVAGEDEAKENLTEIVEYLHDPDKYKEIGASMPKGILLVGPPGTGKTMLAKAVAGEANVPFFSMSGSEFVEMFVGMGASKVRDLFKQAKEKAPCIVFIDEIDAIGKKRDGQIGGNDEREQTLNQLLTEMDGFEGNNGVIILAATNRPESLDPALLRPGRFDRRVPVELPDLKGREEILKVHARKIKVADNVDFNKIARMASGASGAELANIVNEAALRAVRDGRKFATQADLEESIEVVIAGYQKKNAILTDKEKRIVAYHEIGHALVAAKQTNSAPVQKITIVPRTSGALGYTMQVEEEGNHYLMTKEEMENKIATLTGGRAAEEIAFGSVTTGASNDIEQATKLARGMITRYGMSKDFDMVAMETVTNQYLGGDSSLTCSMETQTAIDKEVVELVKKQHEKAGQILMENRAKLDELSQYLYEKETITGEEFMKILNS